MQKTTISLGFDCMSSIHSTTKKWKKTRAEGYNTCVFDLMLSNYSGVIAAIREDFKGLTDPENLVLKTVYNGEEWIFNTKYRFFFNHESNSKGVLIKEPREDPYFYIKNNYEKFIERYERRIQNFRDYLNGEWFIEFVMNFPIYQVPELIETIKEVYPNLKFRIVLLNMSLTKFYVDVIRDMGFAEDTKEYTLAKENKVIHAYYGVPHQYVNIDLGKHQIIPATDEERARLFGDPAFFRKKHVLVETDGVFKLYQIGESVVLPMYREETFIDVF